MTKTAPVTKTQGKNQSTGRFVIPPCCGPNHPHEHYLACEVKLSPKGNYFASCGVCMQNYFLKYWDHGMGYTVADVEQMGLITHIPRLRRLELLHELGLVPANIPPPAQPPMPAKGSLRPPPPKPARR